MLFSLCQIQNKKYCFFSVVLLQLFQKPVSRDYNILYSLVPVSVEMLDRNPVLNNEFKIKQKAGCHMFF